MDVKRRRGRPDGEIVVLGVDDFPIPAAIAPEGTDILLHADGAGWVALAQAPSDWVRFGADAARAVPDGTTVGFRTVPGEQQLTDFVRGWRLGGYRFTGRRSAGTLVLPTGVDVDDVVRETDATVSARDLVNTPSNRKNPAWMVRRARAVARRAGADVEVLGVRGLRTGGFGGVLAVGAGSASPPRVVTIRRPGPGPRVALVGKGITFDSGGLSLKPREPMALMKSDMAGAAAVLQALPLAPPEVDLTVLLGLAENAIGASSYRPGDVITHVDGSTTEVRNTDAEGRLVLADLLAHAVTIVDPDVIVDVATLTGAATMALSREYGALYTAGSAGLGPALREAGRAVAEPLWPMPLFEGYRAALASDVADRCHIPTVEHVGAGSITAALYLQGFTDGRPWAHLDIAGPARATAAGGPRTVGGTGFGAALLGRWLADGPRF
jgi:leucyl aminopeptidase